MDNVNVVQDVIHSSRGRKEKGIIIKLDLANTFDRVDHEILLKVMKRFNFKDRFISWVKYFITFSSIGPLVNDILA